MTREDDVFGSCDDYLAWAVEEKDYEKEMYYLQRALSADPDRMEDVLLAAKGSQYLSPRTSGREFIEELEKRIREKRTHRKRKHSGGRGKERGQE